VFKNTDPVGATPPTLVDLAGNPERVVDVPLSLVPSLMAQAAALQVALAARLADASTTHQDQLPTAHQAEVERLLTPPEAAALLGVTVTWLYRHASRLPFARRLSRKAVRFSEAGLRRWLAVRKPRHNVRSSVSENDAPVAATRPPPRRHQGEPTR
jgi:predicted DNA-binding transcriptional regulator AlpA